MRLSLICNNDGQTPFAGVIVLLGVIYMVRNIDRYEDLNTEFATASS